jgi:lipid-A-disaccharide synthase
MRICLLTTEHSGDRLGGALMRALKARCAEPIEFSGVGGPSMIEEGLATLFSIDDLAFMGIGAIPRLLPMILRRMRDTPRAVLASNPSVLVLIGSPSFTHPVARRVHAAAPQIPIVNYVPPQVWAWRPGRAKAMRGYIDEVMAILPFEPEEYRRLGGPPCEYVGHMLIEYLRQLRPSTEEAQRRLQDPVVLLVLPGSRKGEIKRLLPIFRHAIELVSSKLPSLEVVIPTVPPLFELVSQGTRNWPVPPRIISDTQEKFSAFRVARAALAKSGTVTLELALAGIPMVGAYKISPPEGLIARIWLSVSNVLLPNLLLKKTVIPEFLQGQCTGPNLAEAILSIVNDPAAREAQLTEFKRLDAILQIKGPMPSERAAEIVLKLAQRKTTAT